MEDKKNKRKDSLNDYGKYSSIAAQMIIIILAGTFLGVKLDEYFEMKFPLFKLILIISSIFLALYSVLKDFFKKQ